MRPIENVRLSQKARDQLVKLKRSTGLKQWNVLCRWAFCTSLAEQTKPSPAKIQLDSSVEMTWKVFAGRHEQIYLVLLKQRCKKDGIELTDENLANQFKLHLHRGISYLFADKSIKTIDDLATKLPWVTQDAN